MNKIEELVQQLCPEGVEYRGLGEVISALRTGLNPRQNFKLNLPEAKHYYVTVRELNGFSILITEKTDRVDTVGLSLIQNRSKIQIGDILLSGTGTIGRTALVSEVPNNWNIKEGIYVITPIVNLINERFLIYLIQSSQIHNQLLAKADGSTVSSISMASLRKIQIPVPPLPIQQEIVAILDKFTQLEAELEAELEARRTQYEYYRNELLNFEGKEVEWKTLGEVGTFVRGNGLQKKDFTESGVGCVHYGQIYTYYGTFTDKTKSFVSEELSKKLRKAQKGDLIIATTSENIEDVCKTVVWLGEEEICISGETYIFKHNQNPKYLAYFLQTQMFFNFKIQNVTGTKVIRVHGDKLRTFKIPIPPLSEQERIVGILDKFDALVNGGDSGSEAGMTRSEAGMTRSEAGMTRSEAGM
ncbi:MAG: restriction endonuclease subunit S, partial [Clostridia bacterium]|nr:restriction endonuclease subunit S [Clostridia bacterium]